METYIIILLILLVLQAAIRILKPKINGIIGEKVVASKLSKLPEQQYKILNDIMLRTNYGTTQIDHIVISVYGIFVIETKNYKGWITGTEYGEYWTKNMYGKKYTFRNPIKQNYAHVKALENVMGLTEDKFIPIVAFSGNGDIKVKTKKPVVYIRQLEKVIKEYKDVIFAESELDMLVLKIKNADITTKETKKEHVKQIRSKVKDDNKKVASGICPRCGGNLVTRNGKNGKFKGCSNYPKCRYTTK